MNQPVDEACYRDEEGKQSKGRDSQVEQACCRVIAEEELHDQAVSGEHLSRDVGNPGVNGDNVLYVVRPAEFDLRNDLQDLEMVQEYLEVDG